MSRCQCGENMPGWPNVRVQRLDIVGVPSQPKIDWTLLRAVCGDHLLLAFPDPSLRYVTSYPKLQIVDCCPHGLSAVYHNLRLLSERAAVLARLDQPG